MNANPSQRPRPVSASLLESLSTAAMRPSAIARILASEGPWPPRLERLAAAGVDLSVERARVLGSCLRRWGVVERRRQPAIPLAAWLEQAEAREAAAVPTLVERAGFDPERWALAPRQGGYVTDADGKRRRVAVVRREASPEPEAVAKLLASAMPAWVDKADEADEPRRGGAYCLCLADFQCGKAQEARGGTAELVLRVRSIIRQARAAVAAEKPAEVVIFELGDVCEGNANHTNSSQLASNDLSQAEQLEVCARLILEAIAALAPLVPRLTLVCVRSNHGEERRGGQAVGRGDFGILVGRTIAAALKLAGAEWAGHVRVVTQNALETGVGITVQGLPIAAFHGHYAKSEKNIPTWIAQQAGGVGERTAGECYRTARLVLYGHFHHFHAEQSRGRMIIGCPSLEAGSAWVERASGEYGRPGALALRVRAGRLLGIELLEPADGMGVDRADPRPC